MSDELDAFTYGIVGKSMLERQEIEAKRMDMLYKEALRNSSPSLNMGLNSIAGQGMIGNAQNSLMGTMASGAQPSTINRLVPSADKSPRRSRMTMSLTIVQADNGFIVNIQGESYTDPVPHIAATLEDINTIITSQLASRMLDRTE